MGTRRLAGLSALLAVSGMLVGTVAQQAGATDFAVPLPPSGVSAALVAGGIRVTWVPSPTAAPGITNYVVHAGPDSCPVTVGANATSAVMPLIKGPTEVIPEVQAVNAYGFSADASAAPLDVPSRATPGFRNVQILEFSDFHGAIEKSGTSIGAAVLTTAFAADRRTVKSTVVVSAGDNIGGAPLISSEFAEVPTIEALDLMQIDASTFGNHEHDRPLSHLRDMIDRSDFPWIASNYSSLEPLQGKTNSAQEYIVLDRGGVRIGIVGLNNAETSELVLAGNLDFGARGRQTLLISDRLGPVEQRIRRARADGAQIVIGLLHDGWDANTGGQATGTLIERARALTGLDAVYGAHTHQQYASLAKGRPVVEVPNSGTMYSRTILCLDTRRDRTIGSSVDFVTKQQLATVPEDPATASLVARYKAMLGPLLDERVGVVAGVFPRGGTPPVERSQETPIGDLAADAVRARYGTQFAILNGGGMRDTLPASGYQPADPALRRPGSGTAGPYDVTMGDVMAVLPFGNTAATTTITGAGLWNALENGVSGWPTAGRFPQVSGFRFAFDPTRPVGSRITSVTKADGTPIARDDAVYSVVTVDYMVYGGDGYVDMFSPTTAVMRDPYVDAVVERLRRDLAAGIITQVPVPDGRITVVPPAVPQS